LVSKNQLSAYIHKGFWHPMDNLRDKNNLNQMWLENKAPWRKFF
jgi:glucose-1-phosphate cytidylyltransferase